MCYERLKAQISEKNIHIVRETPFAKGRCEKRFESECRENRKWTFAIDADVVIPTDAIEKLVAFAETAKYDVFLVIGPVIDKFWKARELSDIISIGHNGLLMRQHIPDPQLAIRPETHVRDRMKEKVFHI